MVRDMQEVERTEGQLRNARAFTCTRRGFLPVLVREAIVTLGMLRGGEGCRLSELESLPDEQLASIKPIINPAFEISVEAEHVLARYKKTGATVPLFAVDETAALTAFNLFDGRHTLDEAGARLADQMDWDRGAGFAYARDFFLQLVENLICVPKGPPRALERTA
jgi:hypothetical protein